LEDVRYFVSFEMERRRALKAWLLAKALRGGGGELRTVAAQQMRTSYLCPSVRSLRMNHDAGPRGEISEGNAACSWVRTVELSGVRVWSWRLENVGWSRGIVRALGAMKIVFSTFAVAVWVQIVKKTEIML
jgi:hypothetical protein